MVLAFTLTKFLIKKIGFSFYTDEIYDQYTKTKIHAECSPLVSEVFLIFFHSYFLPVSSCWSVKAFAHFLEASPSFHVGFSDQSSMPELQKTFLVHVSLRSEAKSSFSGMMLG